MCNCPYFLLNLCDGAIEKTVEQECQKDAEEQHKDEDDCQKSEVERSLESDLVGAETLRK
ncbi:hypothetical protein SDC9_106803 [bioreactor metagenome]|uniref:Uncharacterized protein n=1 Tax=bioreactor metagenome TaxID=1076179 RepID=A0A645B3I1_9ZZZZ